MTKIKVIVEEAAKLTLAWLSWPSFKVLGSISMEQQKLAMILMMSKSKNSKTLLNRSCVEYCK